jgi:hypothetical protein
MKEEEKVVADVSRQKREVRRPYEPPKITFIGNVVDLLAGGGSKDTDHGVCSEGVASDPDICS